MKTPVLNDMLSSLKCVQIVGGSKSLFCGELQFVILLVYLADHGLRAVCELLNKFVKNITTN